MPSLIGTPQHFPFAAGGAGQLLTNTDGAPAVGNFDVLCINSDTIITSVSSSGGAAWTSQSQVTNQGAYIYRRKATGGEPATVTVTTSGNFNAEVFWLRISGGLAADIASGAEINASPGGTASPAYNSGALAATNELVIAFAANHNISGSAPTSPSWSAGYTNQISGSQGVPANSAVQGFVAIKTGAGTAAETPSVSWTNGCTNRYILVLSITDSGVADVVITDTPGGARPYTSPDGPLPDDVTFDVPGGLRPYGSAEDLPDDVTFDTPGGLRLYGPVDTVFIDDLIADTPGGLRLYGPTEVLPDDVTFDVPGGVRLFGSTDSLPDDVVFDTPGGMRLYSPAETLLIDDVTTDTPGGLRPYGSQDIFDIEVADSPGGARFYGSPETVIISNVVVADGTVFPMLDLALTCLAAEVAKVARPPKYVRHSTGASFSAQFDQHGSDECCEGVAWVRSGPIFPSSTFPEQDSSAERVEPDSLAVQVEFGIARCHEVGNLGNAIVSAAAYRQMVMDVQDDRAAMFRAACCLAVSGGQQGTGEVLNLIIGDWNPLEDQANCMGGTLQVTVQVNACDCVGMGV